MQRHVREGDEMGKKFRDMSAAGPNNDVTPTFQTVGKIEVKKEPDENEEQAASHEKGIRNASIKVEVESVGGGVSDSEPEWTSTVSNSTERTSPENEGKEMEEIVADSVQNTSRPNAEPQGAASEPEMASNSAEETNLKTQEKEMEEVQAESGGLVSEWGGEGSPLEPQTASTGSNSTEKNQETETEELQTEKVGQVNSEDHLQNKSAKVDVAPAGDGMFSGGDEIRQDPLHKMYINSDTCLDAITSEMTSYTHSKAKVPPFSLTIDNPFDQWKNQEKFSNFLIKFSSGLVNLNVLIPTIPGNCQFMNFRLASRAINLRFPQLRKLTIVFPFSNDDIPFISYALHFIQNILSCADGLKELKVTRGNESRSPLQHLVLRRLKPPPTINSLDISVLSKSSELECLLYINLPHLKCLSFCVTSGKYKDGLVSQILEKFRASLRQLKICDFSHYEGCPISESPTFFRFPLMEDLRTCEVATGFAELEEGHPPLDHLLPNLETLRLSNQMILEWTKSSTLPKVTTLALRNVHWCSVEIPDINLGSTFPNLRSLELQLWEHELHVTLLQVFEELTQLKKLHVTVDLECDCEDCDQCDWENRNQLAKLIELELAKSSLSIVNLKELEHLEFRSDPEFKMEGVSIISDFAFKAFLEMPKLKTLKCGESFMICVC